eukprot:1430845-Amphidinium_carterae.1
MLLSLGARILCAQAVDDKPSKALYSCRRPSPVVTLLHHSLMAWELTPCVASSDTCTSVLTPRE